MNTIFKLLVFSILLNLCSGIIMHILPNVYGGGNFTGGITYDENKALAFVSKINESVSTTTAPVADSSSFFDRVLDFIKIGKVAKFIEGLQNYMFGFTEILRGTFISMVSPEDTTGVASVNFFINIIEVIIGIGYALAAFWLWTGVKILE